MDLTVSLSITTLTIIGILVFDYWDHKLYSDQDDFESYTLFVSNTLTVPIIVASLGLVLFLVIGGTMNQLSLLVLCGGVLFTFYINIYNFISIPQRLLMILSKDITAISDTPPLRMLFLHPSLHFDENETQSYLYSLNSKRSIVIPFSDDGSYYTFIRNHQSNSKGNCSCCGEYSTGVQRVRGKKTGYTDYQVMDKSGSTIGFALSTNVTVCKDCWSNLRPLVVELDTVEEANIVSELI